MIKRIFPLVVTLLCSDLAFAQEPPAPVRPQPGARPAAPTSENLSHRYQFGLGLRAGSGYRIIAPYNEESCGQAAGEKICRGLYPPWFEVSPSFGITDSLELLVDIRLFLGSPDFTKSQGLFIAPGFKYYADPESLFKFFIAGHLVFEVQEQDAAQNADLPGFDFGLRAVMGVQFDLMRYVGLYAQAGLVLGFSRWFSMTADFGGGVQFRY